MVPTFVLLAALSLDGFWASEGYGVVLEIEGDQVESFEVTGVSCLSAWMASSVPAPAGALGAFRQEARPSTFLILPQSDGENLRVHFNGAASDVVFHRIDRMPDLCRQPAPSTPPAIFEVFVTTWAEHYPFFAMRKADWPAIVARHRERIREDMSPQDLFAVLEEMIAPFEDAHTSLRAESIDRSFHGERRSPAWVEESEEGRAYGLVAKYLKGPLRTFCEGQLEHGMLAPDVGYLRLRSFSGYHPDRSFESGLAALDSALDEIFAGAGSWRGLVIDVRINGGGADPYGLAIASRLTDREYVAYAKQARNDPRDATRWTEAQPSYVKPSTRPGFRGPIVELIGIQSVSAAETFTQALLKRRPEVVRVGESTQGVFSDVLGRRLPNGWRFGLPNERFVTDGRAYDGTGIAPAVTVLSFTLEGLASGHDAGIEKALELLAPSHAFARQLAQPLDRELWRSYYVAIMKRTTVMIPAELKARALRQARKRGVSLGSMIRESLESSLENSASDASEDPLFADMAVYGGPVPKNLSEAHDEYLYSEDP
jgi:hypothetical protein